MDLPPPVHLEGGGQLALDVVSPIAPIDSAQRKPRHRMAGLVRKSSVQKNGLSQSLHCNRRPMNGTATIRVPTHQMATGAWMAGLVMLLSRPATAPAVMLSAASLPR